jgi:3-oxoacyl-[acyl-carrier protein] reductase
MEETTKGKVAIVTGASRGIGRAIALALARHGARVALAARMEADLQALREEIESFGGEAAVFTTDVASEADVQRLVQGTVERFGRLDILINNAGVALVAPLEETTTEAWDHIMAINARGPFLLCREAIPHMRRLGGGYIINIASVIGIKGYIRQGAYTASKHALMGMTKVLAQEVQPDNIRVHAICPGGVDTAMIAQVRPDLDSSVLIQPEEIADIVLFLLTRQGNAVIDEVHVRRATAAPWF